MRPSPSRTARAIWVWPQRISGCVMPFGRLLDRFQRRHPHRAVGQNGLQPIDLVAGGRRVAEKDLIAEHQRRRHRAQPVEMPLRRVARARAGPTMPIFSRRPVDQIAVVIAEHVDGVERHQRVHRPPRVERAARHVAEIDDLVDALRRGCRRSRLPARDSFRAHRQSRQSASIRPIPAGCRWRRAHGRRDTATP